MNFTREIYVDLASQKKSGKNKSMRESRKHILPSFGCKLKGFQILKVAFDDKPAKMTETCV